MKSWKAEVYADSGWMSNDLRFATQREAEEYAYDLYNQWPVTTNWRVLLTHDPVTARVEHHRLTRLSMSPAA